VGSAHPERSTQRHGFDVTIARYESDWRNCPHDHADSDILMEGLATDDSGSWAADGFISQANSVDSQFSVHRNV